MLQHTVNNINCQTSKPSILFACRFPPPYTGQTIAARITYELLRNYCNCNYINVLRPVPVGMAGKLNPLGVLATIKNLFHLNKFIKHGHYDVTYFIPSSSGLGHLRDILIVYIISKHTSKIIAHVHSGNFQNIFKGKCFSLLNKHFISRIYKFIFLSHYLSSHTDEFIESGKKIVIPNSIDNKVILSQEECIHKIQEKENEETINIVFISNMIESKGFKDLAKALSFLPANMKWQAHFIGDWGSRELKKSFMDFLSNNNISDRTLVYGKITDRSKIKVTYKEADVFVLPTYYPVEAQPLTIIEALNAATPVIATPHASIPEYVKDGINGFLVPKQNPDEIAAAIIKLSDRKRWSAFAKAARDTYLQSFSTDAIQNHLLDVFIKELKDHK
jgi:glycosyltransferase involved in cell wall biosynthesis